MHFQGVVFGDSMRCAQRMWRAPSGVAICLYAARLSPSFFGVLRERPVLHQSCWNRRRARQGMHGRVRVCRLDLMNAIRDFGGFTEVAEKLQWSVAKETRRPRGYWSNADNIRTEIDLFNDEFHLQRRTVPPKNFLRKMGRFDIVKALERAGGSGQAPPPPHPPVPHRTHATPPRAHSESHTRHFLGVASCLLLMLCTRILQACTRLAIIVRLPWACVLRMRAAEARMCCVCLCRGSQLYYATYLPLCTRVHVRFPT